MSLSSKPKHLVLIAFEGGNASTSTVPLEILNTAISRYSNRTPFEVSLITTDGKPVNCGQHVTITPAESIECVAPADYIFLAGMPCDVDEVIRANLRILDWLRGEITRGVSVATVCPSQALLAYGGFLDGRTVAMHWSLINEVAHRFPTVKWTAERMVVEDRGIYSCCGASATIDLTLLLIERMCGRDTLLYCAQWFLSELPRVRRNSPPSLLQLSDVKQGTMGAVEKWLLENYEQPFHFETLAKEFGMSWRTFYRRFQEAFGDPPKVYLQKLRLHAACRLLEHESAQIDRIAAAVGYSDTAFFRSLFKRYYGMTPSHYRESFRLRSVVGAR